MYSTAINRYRTADVDRDRPALLRHTTSQVEAPQRHVPARCDAE